MKADPSITVGIPTFNSTQFLPIALRSLADCNYDKRLIRVVFVDNYSSDETLEIIEDFKEKYGKAYGSIIVKQSKSNIPRARNICIECAEGSDYIFFLDSDIAIPPDTFGRLLTLFERKNVGMATLHQANVDAVKRASFLLRAFKSGTGVVEAYKVSAGCNMLSMKVAKEVGNFNERLPEQEDGEYCFRIRKIGYTILCDWSLEGTHLKEERVDMRYYLRIISNSSRTYIELLKGHSIVHLARYFTTLVSLGALVHFVLTGSVVAVLLFLTALSFAFWLNTSRVVLDDGIGVKLQYRPFVAPIITLFVAAIVMASLGRILLESPVLKRLKILRA